MLKFRFAATVVFALLGGALAAEEKKEEKKPVKQQATAGGKIKAIDVKAKTVTLHRPFDPNSKDVTVSFGPDVTVFIDGKEAKFEDVPVGGEARVSGGKAESSRVTDATQLMVVGTQRLVVVKKVSGDTLTFKPDTPAGNAPDEKIALAETGKALIGGKEAKLADFKPGDKITIFYTADGKAAIRIAKTAEPKKK